MNHILFQFNAYIWLRLKRVQQQFYSLNENPHTNAKVIKRTKIFHYFVMIMINIIILLDIIKVLLANVFKGSIYYYFWFVQDFIYSLLLITLTVYVWQMLNTFHIFFKKKDI